MHTVRQFFHEKPSSGRVLTLSLACCPFADFEKPSAIQQRAILPIIKGRGELLDTLR